MKTNWVSVVVYTALRIALFLLVWAAFQFLTPWKGLPALILALLVSGAISFFALNRQRDAMSASVFGVFKRMNDRIDAATRKEDVEDDVIADSGVHTDRETDAKQ